MKLAGDLLKLMSIWDKRFIESRIRVHAEIYSEFVVNSRLSSEDRHFSLGRRHGGWEHQIAFGKHI